MAKGCNTCLPLPRGSAIPRWGRNGQEWSQGQYPSRQSTATLPGMPGTWCYPRASASSRSRATTRTTSRYKIHHHSIDSPSPPLCSQILRLTARGVANGGPACVCIHVASDHSRARFECDGLHPLARTLQSANITRHHCHELHTDKTMREIN